MTSADPKTITKLLGDLSGGGEAAFTALVETVYADLHGIARNRMRQRFGERMEAMTLSPTMLVHDAAIELAIQRNEWRNREQFFALATRLMIRTLTDYQRARLAQKRGGGHRGGELAPAELTEKAQRPREDDLDELLRAVEILHQSRPRAAEVVTLHIMADMPLSRVAQLLGVSVPTVERDWRFAKAWLFAEIGDDHG